MAQEVEVRKLALDEAVRMALESNIELAIVKLDPLDAEADIQKARGEFDPRLRGSAGYGETSSPRAAEQIAADGRPSVESRTTSGSAGIEGKTAVGTTLSATTNVRNQQDTFNRFDDEFDSNFVLEARQPLLKNFGVASNLAPIRIARKNKETAKLQFLDEVERTVRDVHYAYYEMVYARQSLSAEMVSLELADRLLRDNRERLRIGVIAPLEVSQAQSEVALRKNDVTNARKTLHENRNALLRLITREISEWLGVELEAGDMLALPGLEPGRMESIQAGLLKRKDYLALLALAERNDLEIVYSKNQLLPQLDLTASYGQNGLAGSFGESYGNAFEGEDPEWFVGLSVEIPWGNRAARADVDQSLLAKERTLLQIKRAEQNVIVEIDNAANAETLARESVENTRQARIAAEESLRAEEEKLLAGASTTYTVLQLQRDLSSARRREIRALADYNRAWVELLRVRGELLEAHKILSD